ncbi:MAG: hypothetical protein IK119_01540 [Bacteroidales bacterium]|nr:hypothetical protein [Bacteroidales bacterium]
MNSRRSHIAAFSLPGVVVVSALVMLLILFAFSLKTLDFQYHDQYRKQKQSRLDIRSALALYQCDSTLLAGADTAAVYLYEDGRDLIGIRKQRWGMYEAVTIGRSLEDPFKRTYLTGRLRECSQGAAFWLCDRNIPLSLAGNTRLEGQVYIPHAGLKYLALSERSFCGDSLSGYQLKASRRYLPRLRKDLWAYLDSLKAMRDTSVVWRDKAMVSFEEPVQLMHCPSRKMVTLRLGGHIVLFGDRLVLSKDSEIKDVMIIARSVVLESGFRGSAQIFCADSIRLRPGVRLSYPSGLFVDASGLNAPCITIGEGSVVEGYVGIHWGEKYHYVLENPCFILAKNARVRGLLYADGSCYIRGSIQGAAYIKDCFYRERYSTYAETLCDVTIERDDSLAFPILLDGPYRRKYIKTVN